MVKRFLKAGARGWEYNGQRRKGSGGRRHGTFICTTPSIWWFEEVVRKKCIGFAKLIPYCDDFVSCFRFRRKAGSFAGNYGSTSQVRHGRGAHGNQRVMKFGRFTAQNAKERGQKPAWGSPTTAARDETAKGFG